MPFPKYLLPAYLLPAREELPATWEEHWDLYHAEITAEAAALYVFEGDKVSGLNPYACEFVPHRVPLPQQSQRPQYLLPPQRPQYLLPPQPPQQPPQLQRQPPQLQRQPPQLQRQPALLPPRGPRWQPKREVVQTLGGSLQITIRNTSNPRR